ncbi:MAG: zinc ribbon domain-containing protein [Candidatus Cloacimonadota bacterium]|jgi:ribosomal protein S27E|nr:zinc ribbon domain-containing protein [Candidatus Cloacimonadota bacterium]NMD13367.1 zinc ribbon domain-containing protein [Candidatus Cloacimonadota bacterium]OQC09233.1 MAG: hypothetical protein BWX75_01222 [Candidatus Cloacimonetes bacterium ADurb.Bin088]
MVLFLLLFALLVIVIVIISSNKKGVQAKKMDYMDAMSVANDVRILLESVGIINDTKTYEVKISRTQLTGQVLDRLNKHQTTHISKGEEWVTILQRFSEYQAKLIEIDQRRQSQIFQVKSDYRPNHCPYCKEIAFSEGSRAIKCPKCGEKAARLKLSKTETILVRGEDMERIREIEAEAISLKIEGGTRQLTVSQDIAMILQQMEEKLSR